MRNELITLLSEFLPKVKNIIDDNPKDILPVEYSQHIIGSLKYDKRGVSGYGATTKYIIKKRLSNSSIRSFAVKEIVKEPAFQGYLNTVSSKWDQYKTKLYLGDLIVAYVNCNFLKNRPRTSLAKLIDQFHEHHFSEELKFSISLNFNGLTVPENEFYIDYPRRIKIRRPTNSDFNSEHQRNYTTDWINHVVLHTSYVIEFSCRYKKSEISDLSKYYSRVVNALRLFKVSSTEQLQYKREVDNEFISVYKNRSYERAVAGEFISKISDIDVPELINMYKQIGEDLPETFDNKVSKTTNHPFDISFQFYSMALINKENKKAKIAYCISCLESLLSSGISELRFRLGMTIAFLMSKFHFESKSLKSIVSDCYVIRSKYYHGDSLSAKLEKKVNSHLVTILEISRVCLIICYQLVKKYSSKNQMIEQITLSMIDVKNNKKLEENLRYVKIYGC